MCLLLVLVKAVKEGFMEAKDDVESACQRYGTHVVCLGVLPVALLYECSDKCILVPADTPFISVGGDGPLLIFR